MDMILRLEGEGGFVTGGLVQIREMEGIK